MPSPTLMLSTLVRQHQLLQAEFLRRYAHCWLVWEASGSRPATSPTKANNASTRLDAQSGAASSPGAESVCLALVPPRFSDTVSIGRDSSNHLVVNDLTFPRHAVVLTYERDVWSARLHPDAHSATRLDGVTLKPDVSEILKPGSALSCGTVTLRFYDAEGFVERLSER